MFGTYPNTSYICRRKYQDIEDNIQKSHLNISLLIDKVFVL